MSPINSKCSVGGLLLFLVPFKKNGWKKGKLFSSFFFHIFIPLLHPSLETKMTLARYFSSPSLSLSLSLSHTHTHTHCFSFAHTFSSSFTHTHTHFFSLNTHSQSISLSHTPATISLSLRVCVCVCVSLSLFICDGFWFAIFSSLSRTFTSERTLPADLWSHIWLFSFFYFPNVKTQTRPEKWLFFTSNH